MKTAATNTVAITDANGYLTPAGCAHIVEQTRRGLSDVIDMYGSPDPEGFEYYAENVRCALSENALRALGVYEVLLGALYMYKNDTADSEITDITDNPDAPELAAVLEHILEVATKATRAKLKIAQGQWTRRQLRKARKASK